MRNSLLTILATFFSSFMSAAPLHLKSPDNKIELTFTEQHGELLYSVTSSGKQVLLPSHLGLGPAWTSGFVVTKTTRSSHHGNWKPVYGERNLIPENYDQLTVFTTQSGKPSLTIMLRAYNEGVAIQYKSSAEIQIAEDQTEFHLPANTIGFQEHGGTEGEYSRASISSIAPKCQTPLTLALADHSYAAILEAASINFPVMTVRAAKDKADTLTAELSSPVTLHAGESTPWRAIMFARSAGELLEHNYFQLNLNEPQAITNTAWIQPGTAMREMSLTTAGAKQLIDFASEHGIDYIGFDDHWYGAEDVEKGDATKSRTQDDSGKPTPPLDIAEVASYGKQHRVGLFIYVDRRQMSKQRDLLFPLYEKWGVAGVKPGFVNVGKPENTAWITETVRKAAEHHLMLDIHDQYRTTGYTRTYPNLLTVEGVRGNEHFPTSTHNATLPFTRFLAGSADVTICYFDKRLTNTPSHQMAMSVIAYSPLQWIFWYDAPKAFQDEPELPWFEHLPTVWDETHVPLADIGNYAVIARRSKDKWYIGAITNPQPRSLDLSLNFLNPGVTYTATLYTDDANVNTATHVAVAHKELRRGDKLQLSLSANGGEAIILQPTK